ncbi:MAG: hypothetical protein ISR58_05385 [Anaerolineales bacterium]|nr:hypothetical protein [Chloroflexota bacterium]MBL6980607.1 hypothetical protein [Anaerolineales bacterium]
MATIFPTNPVGVLPPEVLKTFRALKATPDDYFVWHHLAPWTPEAPDFLIRNSLGQALLLKVSSASSKEARPAAQLLLLESDDPPLGEVEGQVLVDFAQRLMETFGPGSPPKIQAALLFPNIEQRKLKSARPSSADASIQWLGKNFLTNKSDPWNQAFTNPPLSEYQWQGLRQLFTPEVIVPPTLTVRKAPARHLEAELTNFLLDYDQEAAVKTDLALKSNGDSLAQNFRLNLVNGVTGSGKSLILLYRLRLLNELFPGKEFLVLTHNRALIRDLESRYYRLTGQEPQNIRWYTFNGWCRAQWPESEPWIDPIGDSKRIRLLQQVKARTLTKSRLTTGMLRSEVDWVKDNAINNRGTYLEADRRGRGFGLNKEQRTQVFTAINQYQKRLRPKMDWADVPLKMWRFVQDGVVVPHQYDVVLVDEAQFFAPVWFEIVQTMVKSQTGHLFLAADPTQGFLRHGVSWKSLGLEVRGRSYQLKHSYRTTRAIIDFALRLYQFRVPEDADTDVAEILAPELHSMVIGAPPQIVTLTSSQDEISRVANEVVALVGQGVQLGDLLVLHNDALGAERLIDAIDHKLGRGAALDPKDSYPGNYVRVTTINAGTGLEAPIVFLAGVNQLFEEEDSLRLSEEDRIELVLNNTRKIYMAATRAGQKLVTMVVGKIPDLFNHLASEGICEIVG